MVKERKRVPSGTIPSGNALYGQPAARRASLPLHRLKIRISDAEAVPVSSVGQAELVISPEHYTVPDLISVLDNDRA